MANGDLAAAKGLAVFPGTQDRREGYDNDNIRGDEIAVLMDKVRVQKTDPGTVPDGTVWISWS